MTIKSIGLIAALAFVAAACGTKEAPGPLEPGGPTGRVRFVNLVTDPTRIPVNAILEGVPFGVNLGYGATTPATLPSPSTAIYSAILSGARSLVVKKTADTTIVLATIGFTVADNVDYTVYATGGTAGAAVTNFVTTDANPVPTSSQVEVRIINMSPPTWPPRLQPQRTWPIKPPQRMRCSHQEPTRCAQSRREQRPPCARRTWLSPSTTSPWPAAQAAR
jgi:hypothetical protein